MNWASLATAGARVGLRRVFPPTDRSLSDALVEACKRVDAALGVGLGDTISSLVAGRYEQVDQFASFLVISVLSGHVEAFAKACVEADPEDFDEATTGVDPVIFLSALAHHLHDEVSTRAKKSGSSLSAWFQQLLAYATIGELHRATDEISAIRRTTDAIASRLERIASLEAAAVVGPTPFMVAPLTGAEVSRAGLYQATIDAVLMATPARINPIASSVILTGLGGFGKSTLARQVCHDQRVRQHFGDGVLWTTLGQEPNLLDAVAKVYEGLMGLPLSCRDLEQASLKLRTALADRRSLVVIDDAWTSGALDPFLTVEGPSVLLVTTRRQDLVPTAVNIELDRMSDSESFQLLSQRLRPDQVVTDAIEALGEAIAGWPLLLDLAGAALAERVAGGLSANEAINQLCEDLHDLGVTAFDPDGEAGRRAVEATMRYSLKLLPSDFLERYIQLGVFVENEEVEFATIARYWNVDVMTARRYLVRLSRQSLVKLDHKRAVVRLHVVVRDYLCRHLPDVRSAHKRLADSMGGPLTIAAGYGLKHLAYHLDQAGDLELLTALANEPWRRHTRRLTGSDRIYFSDVRLALNALESRKGDLVEILRLSLAIADASAEVSILPTEAFQLLAQVGRLDEALAQADLIARPVERAAGFGGAALGASPDRSTMTWQLAQQAAWSAGNPQERAEALLTIATIQVRAGHRDLALATLDRANAIIDTTGQPWTRSPDLLRTISLVLSRTGQVELAGETVARINDGGVRSEALVDIAAAQLESGRVDQAIDTLDEAIAVTATTTNPRARSAALIAIAATQAQAGMTEQALTTAAALNNSRQNGLALTAIAAALAEGGEIDRAMAIATMIDDRPLRSTAIASIAATQLRGGCVDQSALTLEQAMAIATVIDDPRQRIAALTAVAGVQALGGRSDLATVTISPIVDHLERCDALLALAQSEVELGELDQASLTLERAMAAAGDDQRIRRTRIEALVAIATFELQAGRIECAVAELELAHAAAMRIEEPWNRSGVLVAIAIADAHAGRIDSAVSALQVAHDAALSIDDPWQRTRALLAVSAAQGRCGRTDLGAATLEEATTAATSLDDPWDHTLAYIASAGFFNRGQFDRKARATAASAAGIADHWDRYVTQAAIATLHSSTTSFDDARETASGIETSWTRTEALAAVAGAQAELGRIDRAADAAAAIDDPWDRAKALATISGVLAESGMINQAIATASAMGDPWDRNQSLIAIADTQIRAGDINLAGGTLASASSAALAIDTPEVRSLALIAVAGAFARAGLVSESITTAATIDQPWARIAAQVTIAGGAARAGRIDESIACTSTIDLPWARSAAFAIIANFHAQAGRINEAIETATNISESSDRNTALAAISAALANAGRIDEAIVSAATIDDLADRRAVTGVIADMQARLGHFDQAVATATAIDDAASQRDVLGQVASLACTQDQVRTFVRESRHTLDAATLIRCVASFWPVLLQLTSPEGSPPIARIGLIAEKQMIG